MSPGAQEYGTGAGGSDCQAKGCGSWAHFVFLNDGTGFGISKVALVVREEQGREAD